MAELRSLVVYVDRKTGRCDWQLLCSIDAGAPVVEQASYFFLPHREHDLRELVKVEAFEFTRMHGSAVKVPDREAIAVVEVPRG